MIIITGAAGFIGSVLAQQLFQEGNRQLLLVDEFSRPEKLANLTGLEEVARVDRMQFLQQLDFYLEQASGIYHLGAKTDTTLFDQEVFDTLNINYSTAVFKAAAKHQVPVVYASSAATYGNGECGYSDRNAIQRLQPLNPYGWSKQYVDLWVEQHLSSMPNKWAGLKFFNVYGPNEYHKGRMASVIMHAYNQIQETGKVKLFKSHRPDFEDGKQLRDFIYVKDIVAICRFCMEQQIPNGLYNAGTGKADSFLNLAESTFKALNLEPNIEFVDTPLDIRDKYQYFTEADMTKLNAAGFNHQFTSLEEGTIDYVQTYLSSSKYYTI